jgi:hypothetical protein
VRVAPLPRRISLKIVIHVETHAVQVLPEHLVYLRWEFDLDVHRASEIAFLGWSRPCFLRTWPVQMDVLLDKGSVPGPRVIVGSSPLVQVLFDSLGERMSTLMKARKRSRSP